MVDGVTRGEAPQENVDGERVLRETAAKGNEKPEPAAAVNDSRDD